MGFKPRTFQTAVGKLHLKVPQVRESDAPFRTSLLEQGSRSDRALKSAIATMYVEGVSTRRVSKVMEKLCGFLVSSTQVSKLTAELDIEFKKWRERPLPPIIYLTLDATYYKVRIDGTVQGHWSVPCKCLIESRLAFSLNKVPRKCDVMVA